MKKLSLCFMILVALTHFMDHVNAQNSSCETQLRIFPNREFVIPYVHCFPLEYEQMPLGNATFGQVCQINGFSLDNPHGFFYWTNTTNFFINFSHNFGPDNRCQLLVYGPIHECYDLTNRFNNNCPVFSRTEIYNNDGIYVGVPVPGLYIIVVDGYSNSSGSNSINIFDPNNNPGNLDKTLTASATAAGTGSINVTLTAAFGGGSVFTPHPQLTQMFNDCTFLCDNCPVGTGGGCNPFDPISIIEVSHPQSWVVDYSSSLNSEEFYFNITECYESGELCVKYQYDNCVDSICVFLEIAFDTLYKCPNETVVYKGTPFLDPGDYVVQEGFLFNNVHIINYPGGTRAEESIVLCAGSEYQAPDGQIYTEDFEIVEIINTNNPCPDTMVTLIRFINPNIILSKSGDFSCTSESVTLNASVQNMMDPDSIISYWIDPDMLQIDASPNEPVEVLKSGTYTFFLTILKGDLICEFSATLEVNFNNDSDNIPLDNWITLDTLICEGDMATFHFAGPAQMSEIQVNAQSIIIEDNTWTSQILTENTCFEVLFVSENGLCSLVENICVSVVPQVNQDLGDLQFCSGDSIYIAGTYYNTGGNYQVEITSFYGCDTTLMFSLIEIAADTTYLFDTICTGNAYSIHGYVYHDAGTYLILLENQFGCDSLLILNLEVQPSDTITSTIHLCPAEIYNIRGREVSTLPWTFSMDSTDISGCIVRIVEQYEMHEAMQYFPEIINPCAGESGGSIRLSGSGNIADYTFNWIPLVSESNVAENLAAGLYDLSISDDNGCMQTFSWNLTENQMEEIEINITHESCPGSGDGRIEFLGNDIAELYLNGIKFDKTQLQSLSHGEYNLEITDQTGCSISRLISINPGNDIDLELPDTIFISQAELGLSKVVPILWSEENQILEIKWWSAQVLDCESCQYPSIWVNELDSLLLQVTSISGCVRNFKSILFPELKQNNFLPTAFSPNGDGINDSWNIYGLQKFSSFHVRIYNRWGVKIADRTITEASTSLWDGYAGKEICPPGPYIYQIEWLDLEGKTGKFFGSVEVMR